MFQNFFSNYSGEKMDQKFLSKSVVQRDVKEIDFNKKKDSEDLKYSQPLSCIGMNTSLSSNLYSRKQIEKEDCLINHLRRYRSMKDCKREITQFILKNL